jgi:very-short-patch-repair endonuclease
MTNLSADAQRVLASQHGVASTDQLIAAGHTKRQIERLEQLDQLQLVVRGAYRSPIAPFDDLARCAAICLGRPNVVIASMAAGRLWGFRRLPRDARVHIIGPRASNPGIAPWVVTYHTDAIHPYDILTRSDGIRLTTRVRTAFDLARSLKADDLLSVIEQVVHDGGVTEDALWDVATEWVSPRRPWIQHYLRQVVRRFPGGAAESHHEVVVASMLREAGVGGLVRQHRIDLPGYGLARFDLAVPPLKLAIEVDVHPEHQTLRGRTSDERRDAAAARQGWLTCRVTADDYAHRLREMTVRIATLARSRASLAL